MFNKIGLGGILTFNSRNAERNLNRTNRAFRGMGNSARRASRGTGLSTTAITGAAMALAPLVMVGGAALKVYTDFTKQMSAVAAVGQLTEEQFKTLREEAVRLGGSTAFTATEAAQGMEELKRAGFSVAEVMAATGAALNLAAADGISLSVASRITANVIRSMGLEATEAGRVTDVLALTSANANTDVTALGEAFKMSASTMNLLKIPLEEGAAILGKLADAGLRGTQGGTAFNNMMNKLIRPTSKASAFMEKYNINVTDAGGKMRKVSAITQDLGNALNGIGDDGERVAMAMELTGLRGVKAVNALLNSLKPPNTLTDLEKTLDGASGAAKRMADERLNNMSGQVTLLKSAIEGFTIRLLDMFKSLNGDGLAPLVQGMMTLNKAWDHMTSIIEAGASETDAYESTAKKFGGTVAGIIFGIRDGIEAIRTSVKFVISQISKWSGVIEDKLGGDGVRSITKFIVIFGGLSALAAPFVIALLGIGYVLVTVIIPAATAAASALAAAFWPVLIVVGILAAAFFLLRNENESLGETAVRIWGAIKSAAQDLWLTVLQPMWLGMKFAAEQVWPSIQANAMAAFAVLKQLVNEFIALWRAMSSDAAVDWGQVGRVIVKVGAFIVNVVLKNIALALGFVRNGVETVRGIFMDLGSGNTLQAVKRLANALINMLLLPLRSIAGVLANLMESALEIPGAARALGEQKHATALKSAKALKSFASEGVKVFDVPDVPDAPDALSEIKGKDDQLQAINDIEIDQAAFKADRLAGVVGGMKNEVAEGIAAGMEGATVNADVTTTTEIDGKEVSKSTARAQQDLADRIGFNTPPFARRVAADQGSLPAS